MILLIEPNKHIRKRLCDLLSRERILGADSIPQTLEMICKFKNNINIIIANIRLLNDILARGTLFKLCQKLYIEIPPILALYRKGDKKIIEELEKNDGQYKLVEYDKDDNSFPERYIQAVQELYPEVMADIKKATEVWLRGEESETIKDPRQWLMEQGFLEAIESSKIGNLAKDVEQIVPLLKKLLIIEATEAKLSGEDTEKECDYKKMYFELKKKYDMLSRYVQELVDFTKEK